MKSKIKPALFAVYGRALRLFPFRFRLKYKDQLLQTLSDAYSESSLSPARFWLRAFVDLLTSSLRERIVTMQQQILKRPILFHAVGLALILTVLGGA